VRNGNKLKNTLTNIELGYRYSSGNIWRSGAGEFKGSSEGFNESKEEQGSWKMRVWRERICRKRKWRLRDWRMRVWREGEWRRRGQCEGAGLKGK